jgi:D-tagatose-1,6-bisphosphate aldolase subunit GatZ/KbaZ
VIALVVQPGVEFGHADVIHFEPGKARDLTACLSEMPGIVFEAHSTDYQRDAGLAALVQNGFAILKVGPWLTFALREALYGLDAAADVLGGDPPRGRLMAAMEGVMLETPGSWKKYYEGDETELWLQRHFSYSDRIRYYWPTPKAEAAVAQLRQRLEGKVIPETVARQYLPGNLRGDGADEFLLAAVQDVLRIYLRACISQASTSD